MGRRSKAVSARRSASAENLGEAREEGGTRVGLGGRLGVEVEFRVAVFDGAFGVAEGAEEAVHGLLDAGDFFEADLVNLVGRVVGGGVGREGGGVGFGAAGEAPEAGVVGGDFVVLGEEGADALEGGDDGGADDSLGVGEGGGARGGGKIGELGGAFVEGRDEDVFAGSGARKRSRPPRVDVRINFGGITPALARAVASAMPASRSGASWARRAR